jgi:hypothetical protein
VIKGEEFSLAFTIVKLKEIKAEKNNFLNKV